MTRTRGRVGARARGRARGTGQGGAGARTRLSARPEGRAGTLGSHALRLPGARAPFRFRRAVRQPVDVRQQHVRPDARRCARRPEGHRRGEWRRRGLGLQRDPGRRAWLRSRRPAGSSGVGAGDWSRRDAACLPACLPSTPTPTPEASPRSGAETADLRPMSVPQGLSLTFALGNFCDEKFRLCA